jgi:hypothetical protein
VTLKTLKTVLADLEQRLGPGADHEQIRIGVATSADEGQAVTAAYFDDSGPLVFWLVTEDVHADLKKHDGLRYLKTTLDDGTLVENREDGVK